MHYTEASEQMMLVSWMSLKYPKISNLLVHIPNGVYSSVRTGARMKRLGLRAGVPDLVVFCARHGFHGLFIEMKSEKGRLTKTQIEYHKLLEEQGYLVKTARGFDEAKEIIESYLA